MTPFPGIGICKNILKMQTKYALKYNFVCRSGGKPHPRGYGTFPRVLKNYVRQTGLFSLEEGVRKMTSMTAQRFGILNRGLIRNGMAADLVLFDDNFEDGASYEDPTKLPTQVFGVWVNGELVVDMDGMIVGGDKPGKPGLVLKVGEIVN